MRLSWTLPIRLHVDRNEPIPDLAHRVSPKQLCGKYEGLPAH